MNKHCSRSLLSRKKGVSTIFPFTNVNNSILYSSNRIQIFFLFFLSNFKQNLHEKHYVRFLQSSWAIKTSLGSTRSSLTETTNYLSLWFIPSGWIFFLFFILAENYPPSRETLFGDPLPRLNPSPVGATLEMNNIFDERYHLTVLQFLPSSLLLPSPLLRNGANKIVICNVLSKREM